jgi:hypothetical protein
MINSDASNRVGEEVIITNYEVKKWNNPLMSWLRI